VPPTAWTATRSPRSTVPYRFIHTSDWHVGRTIARHSRLDEARAAIAAIRGMAEQHRVDAVVVAGDVFDQQHPSADATRVVYHGLRDLADAGVQVLVVAGNHDNPRRWDAVRPLLGAHRVHVVPSFRRAEDGGRIVLCGADGTECEFHALPWIAEREVVDGDVLMDLLGRAHQQYAARMEQLIEQVVVQPEDPGRPQVLVAHLFYAGGLLGGAERTLTSGLTYQVPTAGIPGLLSYAALGHLHRAQRVAGAGPDAYYSGSPLQLDFSEAGQDKSAYLVELEPGLRARVQALPLDAGRPLRELNGTLEELAEQREEAGPAWVSVRLRCLRAEPGLADRVREVVPDAVRVVLEPAQTTAPRPRTSVRGLEPREQFARYLQESFGQEPEAGLLDRFDGLLGELDAQEPDGAPA